MVFLDVGELGLESELVWRVERLEAILVVDLVGYDSHEHLESGLIYQFHAADWEAFGGDDLGLEDAPPHQLAARLDHHYVQLAREPLLLDAQHQPVVEVLPK